VVIPRLLIFDIASASFTFEDENSNSKMSKMITAINEVIWVLRSTIGIIIYFAKAAKTLELKQQSSRGA
jgi:hypothetical protein